MNIERGVEKKEGGGRDGETHMKGEAGVWWWGFGGVRPSMCLD